jgi:hypothetical protein
MHGNKLSQPMLLVSIYIILGFDTEHVTAMTKLDE